MSSYLGLDDFCQYGIGTAASVAFGNFTGEITDEGSFKHEEGAAGADDIIWEMHQPKAHVESVYKGESLLTAPFRASYNAMPSLISLWGGVLASAASLSRIIATAYVDALELSGAGVGEAVKAVYDIIGIHAVPTTATAGQIATATPTAPFTCQAVAVTIGTAALGCKEWTVKIENGMTHEGSQDAKSTGSQRIPECIDLGSEKVTAKFTVRIPPTSLEFDADTPTLPITAQIVIGNGYTLHTINARDLYVKPYGAKMVKSDEKHTWDLDCEARYNALRSAATAALSIA